MSASLVLGGGSARAGGANDSKRELLGWTPDGTAQTTLFQDLRKVFTVKRFKGIQVTEPNNTFWGDRMYDVVDRDGHRWTFAGRKSMPPPEQMTAAMQAMMGG